MNNLEIFNWCFLKKSVLNRNKFSFSILKSRNGIEDIAQSCSEVVMRELFWNQLVQIVFEMQLTKEDLKKKKTWFLDTGKIIGKE